MRKWLARIRLRYAQWQLTRSLRQLVRTLARLNASARRSAVPMDQLGATLRRFNLDEEYRMRYELKRLDRLAHPLDREARLWRAERHDRRRA